MQSYIQFSLKQVSFHYYHNSSSTCTKQLTTSTQGEENPELHLSPTTIVWVSVSGSPIDLRYTKLLLYHNTKTLGLGLETLHSL